VVYYDAASSALDQWLVSQGSGPGVPVPTPTAGIQGGTETTLAYPSSPTAPEPVTVLVTLSKGTASGLSASVQWHFAGFKWTAGRHEERAREAIQPLTRWWESYQKSHPRPGTLR
jgi:hypothetical protein